MNQQASDIQLVIATLQSLKIDSTYDNMNKLLGSIQLLEHIGNDVAQMVFPDQKTDGQTANEAQKEEPLEDDIPAEVEEINPESNE